MGMGLDAQAVTQTTSKREPRMAGKKSSKQAAAKKTSAIQEKYTKTAILNDISESTGLSKKQVGQVLDGLGDIIERHLKKRGAGEFTLPGLLKIKAVKRPARPARKGVPNPFKPGELMDIPKKPASIRVKVLPLKKLKAFAEL
jgi:nucleoid DNA-binding protein